MTTFLLIVIALLIGVIIWQLMYRKRIRSSATNMIHQTLLANIDLEEQLAEARSNYQHLEEGQQELIDNYENDFLDLNAKVEAANNSAAYDREKREEIEKKIAQWDTAIQNHAGHCDTIIHEMVDLMMEEIQPKSE